MMNNELTRIIHYTVTAKGNKTYEIRSTNQQYLSIIKSLLAQDGLVYDDITEVIINDY